ncbi:MAG: hypothetical protein IJ319_04435 [Bacteroidaceae bacterium]|nr:hypothetical protein [Bacteroidaceae bacterium]
MKTKLFFLLFFLCYGVHIFAQKSAKIENVWHEENITRNGKKGILVHTRFIVDGMKNEPIRYIIFFYDSNKKGIRTPYTEYQTTEGTACIVATQKSDYDSCIFTDFELFMPYDVLSFSDFTNKCYYNINIRDTSDMTYATSDYYAFTAKVNSYIVTTNDGYIQYVDNENGSLKEITYKRCIHCGGQKLCRNCFGTGNIISNPMYGAKISCYYCGGLGHCTQCNNNGMISFERIITIPVYNVNNRNNNTHDEHSGYSQQNHINNSVPSNATHNNETNSSKICTHCDGNGEVIQNIRTSNGPDGPRKEFCSICNRNFYNTRHVHRKCVYCQGKGYR